MAPLDGPRPAAGAGDVVAVDQKFLEQMTRDRRRCEPGAAQPGDGVRAAVGGDLVEVVGQCGDAVGEGGRVPLAVIVQHRLRQLGDAGGVHRASRHRPPGQSIGVGAADVTHVGGNVGGPPRPDGGGVRVGHAAHEADELGDDLAQGGTGVGQRVLRGTQTRRPHAATFPARSTLTP